MNHFISKKHLNLGMLLVLSSAQVVKADDFLSMSLEDLMNVEVTSVSKKTTKLTRSAAAIYVVSQEDIKHSGAISIPEALKMIPGIQVAQMSSSTWAVSSRGFNSRFANKLLVLIDGRSIYNNTFSGVYWDANDVVMEDIDRIEMIRGPGAALWGSNAVNGVINIITKNTSETKGNDIVARISDNNDVLASWRQGGEINDNLNYRVYGKYKDSGEYKYANGDNAGDDWEMRQVGFRFDSGFDKSATFTLQGDYAKNDNEQLNFVNVPNVLTNDPTDGTTGNILARYTRNDNSGGEYSLQFYFDHTSRDESLIMDRWNIYDIDIQYSLAEQAGHNIIVGGGYRYKDHQSKPSIGLNFDPVSANYEDFSFFAQDTISLLDNQLELIIGAKVEYNALSNDQFQFQPNVRASYQINEKSMVWGSTAKALRTPSLVEQQGVIVIAQNLPVIVRTLPNNNMESEELIAYELGYRTTLASQAYLDIAVFYNDYDSYRSLTIDQMNLIPQGPVFIALAEFGNEFDAESYGIEVALDWGLSETWNVNASYSYITQKTNGQKGDTSGLGIELINNPSEHVVNLRSTNQLTEKLVLDTWVNFRDGLVKSDIESYTNLDMRLGWQINPQLEFSLIGKNLVGGSRAEFLQEFTAAPDIEIQRTLSASVKWSF